MFTKREMNFSASTTLMLVISSMKLIISVQVSILLYLNIHYQSQKEAKTEMFSILKAKKKLEDYMSTISLKNYNW